MNMKAFGTANPEPEAKLIGAGSSSLEFMKKALSFYMPNNKENWDGERNHGNPTRSQPVKSLMQRVAALGGGRKKNASGDSNGDQNSNDPNAFPVVPSDGPKGMLNRMQTQNMEFINILSSMGTALQMFGRSVEQMKSALEKNNIAIRTELASQEEAAVAPEDDAEEDTAANAATATSTSTGTAAVVPLPEPMQVDLPAIANDMRQEVAQVAHTLQEFMNTNVVTNRDMTMNPGADGFCTFTSSKTGKQMDVPDGFDLPSCDLLRAWRHWIIGFPDFRVRNDNDEIVDAPIRPLRFVNTTDLPQSQKKKFKDGWRPILLSMQGDVVQMLESTPLAAMNDLFIADSYNTAMIVLTKKAPGIFAESSAEKCGTWKVATWSRKIREQQLGQHQVRRRREEMNDQRMTMNDATALKVEQHPVHHPPPAIVVQLRPPEEQQQAQLVHPPQPPVPAQPQAPSLEEQAPQI